MSKDYRYVPTSADLDRYRFGMIAAIGAVDLTIEEQVNCHSLSELYNARGYVALRDDAKFDHAWWNEGWKP